MKTKRIRSPRSPRNQKKSASSRFHWFERPNETWTKCGRNAHDLGDTEESALEHPQDQDVVDEYKCFVDDLYQDETVDVMEGLVTSLRGDMGEEGELDDNEDLVCLFNIRK